MHTFFNDKTVYILYIRHIYLIPMYIKLSSNCASFQISMHILNILKCIFCQKRRKIAILLQLKCQFFLWKQNPSKKVNYESSSIRSNTRQTMEYFTKGKPPTVLSCKIQINLPNEFNYPETTNIQ